MLVLDRKDKIKKLEEELKKYKDILVGKMKNFRGVRHENALSELRYSEVMVYRDMIVSLEKEIKELKNG